ncbi:phosphoribosylglycinamide formyltransferase [Clostridium sp.]
MLRVVVMVSGGGTNLQAILDAVDNGKITNAEVVAVISNNEGAYAIERAKNHGVPAFVVTPKAYETRDAFNEALLEAIKACKPDLIVLAGFLVKIPAAMIEAYRNKIINVHPSLIPSFCGVGYYGLKVHEAALARGVKVTGATVHYVDEGTDTGPILFQKAVEVQPDDTPKTLQQRVMEQAEWVLLPQAINAIANGRI